MPSVSEFDLPDSNDLMGDARSGDMISVQNYLNGNKT